LSTAPDGVSVQLARALRTRDDARKHSASAEELVAADVEVERLKSLVNDRLNEIAVELDGLRREAGAQEVRYKTGEYTEVQYRNATADVRRRIGSLERLEESFSVLLLAETEADIRHTSGRPTVSLGVTSPAAVKQTAREELSRAREYVPRAKGLGGIPAPKWMLIGSGVLIAVGAVAVVILLIQSVTGSFNLPSLPSLFQRDGGTSTAPLTPASAFPPATTAPASTEFQVPVQLRGAQGVGSLYVELAYDPSAVELIRLDYAAMPAGTLSDHGLGQGTVSIGLVTSGGLTGDWVIAFITCRRAPGAATSGDSTITVSEVRAHRATDLAEVLAHSSNGHVNLSSLAVAAPTITFG
jgi:hypothetical protein